MNLNKSEKAIVKTLQGTYHLYVEQVSLAIDRKSVKINIGVKL